MARGQYLPISPRPGAWRNGSRLEAQGRWFDVNQVRWRNGRMSPIGGWERFASLAKPARGLHGWRANNGTRWLAIGTAAGLLVHDTTQLADITPQGFAIGRDNSNYGLGWGAGKFGMDAYGTARTSSGIILDAATWSMDNFGEVMVGVSSGDGKIYEWSPSQVSLPDPQNRAFAVVNAPIDVAFTFVTDERHLVALGADGNPRKIKWCSRENRNLWRADATNSAGGLDVTTAGKLLAAAKYRTDYLIFTDCDVHVMHYSGSPLGYGVEGIGDGGGLVGPKAVVSLGDRAVWMGPTGFWQYDGVANLIPCDVQEYVYRDFNLLQGAKVAAAHNSQFGEVWWFYPSADSVENNRVVIWSYREGWWGLVNDFSRTAWEDKGAWTHIVGADVDGALHQHEQGFTANGVSRVGKVYADSGSMELGDGSVFAECRMLIPDKDDNIDNVAFTFRTRENPRGETLVVGPFDVEPSTGLIPDARFAGREVEVRVDLKADGDFFMGMLRADVVPGSGR